MAQFCRPLRLSQWSYEGVKPSRAAIRLYPEETVGALNTISLSARFGGWIYFSDLAGAGIFDIPDATQAANLVSGFSELKFESGSMEPD